MLPSLHSGNKKYTHSIRFTGCLHKLTQHMPGRFPGFQRDILGNFQEILTNINYSALKILSAYKLRSLFISSVVWVVNLILQNVLITSTQMLLHKNINSVQLFTSEGSYIYNNDNDKNFVQAVTELATETKTKNCNNQQKY